MASANFKGGKIKSSGAAKAHARHNFRQNKNYSNQEINPELTPTNVILEGGTYEDFCRRFDEKIRELDQMPGQNMRKDRVLSQEIEIPCPKDLPPDQVENWGRDAADVLKDWNRDYTGTDSNIMYIIMHRDEIHEYVDSRTGLKTMSRCHIHSAELPIDNRGIFYCKGYSARWRINDLNKRLQDMTLAKYGVNFMDGSKAKHKDSVENLKVQSARPELVKLAKAKTDLANTIAERRVQEHILKLEKDLIKAAPSHANEWGKGLDTYSPNLATLDLIMKVLIELIKLGYLHLRAEQTKSLAEQMLKTFAAREQAEFDQWLGSVNKLESDYSSVDRPVQPKRRSNGPNLER